MEKLSKMLSAGRIIRLLILVLACIAIWKVWDYVGWNKSKNLSDDPAQPQPVLDSSIKVCSYCIYWSTYLRHVNFSNINNVCNSPHFTTIIIIIINLLSYH